MKNNITLSTESYDKGLKERLKKTSYAVAYLRACIEESAADMPDVVFNAIRMIADVHGMTWLSKQTGIPRQTLYQMFSDEGHPSIRVFIIIMQKLGIRLTFEVEKKAKSRRPRARTKKAA